MDNSQTRRLKVSRLSMLGFLQVTAVSGRHRLGVSMGLPLILKTAIGRVEGWCAGQGAIERNGHSIPRRCNAAMHNGYRAIQPVALSPDGCQVSHEQAVHNHDVIRKFMRSIAVFRLNRLSACSFDATERGIAAVGRKRHARDAAPLT